MINTNLKLPQEYDPGSIAALLRDMGTEINKHTENRIGGSSAASGAPTTGRYQQGDFVRNSAPSELGTAGSKYVIFGWICVGSGEPGTWLQMRMLTGN